MFKRSTFVQALWLKSLLFALFSYAAFGRTFAYLFVGELILVVGLVIFLLNPRFMVLMSDRVLLLWALFAIWGFCRTIPFLSTYRFFAVRDAVVWAYGAFALLIVTFVNSSSQISGALNTYRKFLICYVPVVALIVGVSQFAQGSLPRLPWASDITVPALKAPDAGVHLAAAGLFLLLFPDNRRNGTKPSLSIYRVVCFLGWSACAVEIAVLSRGGFVAMMIPITIVSLLKPRVVGWKVVTLGIMVVLISGIILGSNLITAHVRGRSLDAQTITKNVTSIVGSNSGGGDQEDNKAWRLIWWKKIIRYTFLGPYFWQGKGFGVNLTTSDGPPGIPSGEQKLRSPHNGNMTVLARMGVPGLLIWMMLNGLFAFKLFRAYRAATRAGALFWSRVNLWLLCYWLSIVINMSFDVYLEGPQGGIWYWSIIGFGVAVLRIQAFEARQARVRTLSEPAAYLQLQPDPVLA